MDAIVPFEVRVDFFLELLLFFVNFLNVVPGEDGGVAALEETVAWSGPPATFPRAVSDFVLNMHSFMPHSQCSHVRYATLVCCVVVDCFAFLGDEEEIFR